MKIYQNTVKQNRKNQMNNTLIFLSVVWILTAFNISDINAQDLKNDTFPIHDNIRTQPYPRTEHVLYLNPPPFLVPAKMKTTDSLQFEISQKSDFKSADVIQSRIVPWAMFSPHQLLSPGTWFWRFRSIGEKNGDVDKWSKSYSFTIKESTPEFFTPPFEKLIAGIPNSNPRLNAFLQKGLSNARKYFNESAEYKELISRAQGGLKLDCNSLPSIGTLSNNVEFLQQAFTITGDKVYADKMIEIGKYMISISNDKSLEVDFTGGDYCLQLLNIYDLCYNSLNDIERKKIQQIVVDWSARFYRSQALNYEENHVFDNHFWQHTIRVLFQTGIMFHDKNPLAREMLEYCYELWSTRGPGGGFILDGNWNYGTSYFNVDVATVYYMSAALTYFTGYDFLQHPWYQHVGQALPYIWPPDSKSAGFGDGHEIDKQPSRIRIALADYIARETKNPYAAWYVNECDRTAQRGGKLSNDFLLRLYRFANMNNPYDNPGLPENHPKLMWFKDCGEVEAHSNISYTKNSLFLSFRSSPYGSGSHTLADQNSFNLHYKGVPVYRSTGYYWNFSDAHNLLSYRNTRAHNTILVDGIGQPFTTRAYGNITRAFDGKNISYSLGDASNAYSGISEYPMWMNNFDKAGLEQSRENGFGKTPLTKYRRHILLLHPDKVVIYDELEASRPVRWDWLLHSPTQFSIDEKENQLITNYEENEFKSVAQMFCNQSGVFSQTDQYAADPDPKKNRHKVKVHPEWHLTASFGASQKIRILTVIQVTPYGTIPLKIKKQSNGKYLCGDWSISAELNEAKPVALEIRNKKKDVLFSLGDDSPVIKKDSYRRQQSGSSVLYDEIDGKKQVIEMSDRPAQGTR